MYTLFLCVCVCFIYLFKCYNKLGFCSPIIRWVVLVYDYLCFMIIFYLSFKSLWKLFNILFKIFYLSILLIFIFNKHDLLNTILDFFLIYIVISNKHDILISILILLRKKIGILINYWFIYDIIIVWPLIQP